MRRKLTAATTAALFLLTAVLAAGGGAATGAPPPLAPEEFFGIGPQTPITESDAEYMKAGGVGTVRLIVPWITIQGYRRGGYDWTPIDEEVGVAARAGIRVLPVLYGTPRWLGKMTNLPIDNARQRAEWKRFVTAAVERYGPRGEFWREHATTVNYEPAIPKLPIRAWQVWNEANFFYFTTPASPSRYARLVTATSRAIKAADPGAKVVLSGLFADPAPGYPNGRPAAEFLEQLYRVPGIKSRFDGIALHPYAVDTETLEEFTEEFYGVALANRDRPGLYITEMGWGSEPNFQEVAFEQGPQGQARQLRGSYRYLLENRRRLNVKQVYWFSWKDIQDYCNFCDSVGLFHEGRGFRPKPAWRSFVRITGGSVRP